PSWTRTPSISVSQHSTGLRSVMATLSQDKCDSDVSGTILVRRRSRSVLRPSIPVTLLWVWGSGLGFVIKCTILSTSDVLTTSDAHDLAPGRTSMVDAQRQRAGDSALGSPGQTC